MNSAVLTYPSSLTTIINVAVTKVTAKHPGAIAIYLYGSFASDHYDRDSDIDLAVLLPYKKEDEYKCTCVRKNQNKSNAVELWGIAQAIGFELKREVDLIDLRAASTVLRFQIIKNGILIYTHDEHATERFADLVFSMYIDFSEDRGDLRKIVRGLLSKAGQCLRDMSDKKQSK